MEAITLNGRVLNVQGIKELKPGMSVQEAALKTKKNGIDEIYFNVDGKNFLAYGDALKIGELNNNNIASVTYNGRAGTVVAHEDEINSAAEGFKTGALNGIKKTKDAIFGAVSNTVTSVGPTAAMVAGGAIGLTGLAVWRGASLSAISTGVGAAASPLGNIFGDILKNGSIGALKVITVAGAIGFGVTALAGAIGGVSDVYTAEKDYSTIASVTKDGNEGAIPGTTPAVTTPAAAVTETPVANPVVAPPVQQPTIGITRPGGQMGVFSRPELTNLNNQFSSVSGYLSSR